MKITRYDIAGPVLLTPNEYLDDRGAFSETFSQRGFADAIGNAVFVQDNQSWSRQRGTVRGLHFQLPPAAQAKLVRVVKGAILDVAVDLRPLSPTYKQHVRAELTEKNRAQFFVPRGFAHGFCTLEDDTIVLYKVDDYHAPGHDKAVSWQDRELAIDWPVAAQDVIISKKDAEAPSLADIDPPFPDWTA